MRIAILQMIKHLDNRGTECDSRFGPSQDAHHTPAPKTPFKKRRHNYDFAAVRTDETEHLHKIYNIKTPPQTSPHSSLAPPPFKKRRCDRGNDNAIGKNATEVTSETLNNDATNLNHASQKGHPKHLNCNPQLSSIQPSVSSQDTNHRACKTRTTYNQRQLQALERVFQNDQYPDGDKQESVSKEIGVPKQKIKVCIV